MKTALIAFTSVLIGILSSLPAHAAGFKVEGGEVRLLCPEEASKLITQAIGSETIYRIDIGNRSAFDIYLRNGRRITVPSGSGCLYISN
jgi:hypothetical protein